MEWKLEIEYQSHARTFQKGDFVRLRIPCPNWGEQFITNYGAGPFMILGIGEGGGILLGDLNGTAIKMNDYHNNPRKSGSWYFGHFFVKDTFMSAVADAIRENGDATIKKGVKRVKRKKKV